MTAPDVLARSDESRGVAIADAQVVVCVPTYRRPAALARLLRSLAQQRGVARFAILVGNNDDRALFDDAVPTELPAFDTLHVATRGVTAVRNAMVADVLARAPVARWIACLDDDQEPAADWLAALLAAGEHHDADLAGGPVARVAARTTRWSRGAADTSYLPRDAGPVTTLNEAGNLLIATRFLRMLPRPPFSTSFGRTGGEDYEFFLLARSRGARIVWAPAARVSEALGDERLGFRSFVWRFYSIAAYQARADRAYRGAASVLRDIAMELLKLPFVVARMVWRERDLVQAAGLVVRCAAIVAGRLVGLAGVRAERYGDALPGAAPRR